MDARTLCLNLMFENKKKSLKEKQNEQSYDVTKFLVQKTRLNKIMLDINRKMSL